MSTVFTPTGVAQPRAHSASPATHPVTDPRPVHFAESSALIIASPVFDPSHPIPAKALRTPASSRTSPGVALVSLRRLGIPWARPWTPHVVVPSGAAAAGRGRAATRTAARGTAGARAVGVASARRAAGECAMGGGEQRGGVGCRHVVEAAIARGGGQVEPLVEDVPPGQARAD